MEPTSIEEYNTRYHAGLRVSGFGMETTTHYPCPFCAAPDVMAASVLDTRTAMEAGATCGECGRSFRARFTDTDSAVSFSIVQTGGAEPPPWLPPIPRVDATG